MMTIPLGKMFEDHCKTLTDEYYVRGHGRIKFNKRVWQRLKNEVEELENLKHDFK